MKKLHCTVRDCPNAAEEGHWYCPKHEEALEPLLYLDDTPEELTRVLRARKGPRQKKGQFIKRRG